MKKALVLATMAATLFSFHGVTNAAVSPEADLVYYSFGCCQNQGLEYGATVYSSSFTSDSSGTIVLNGWQENDDPTKFVPRVKYSVVTYNYFGDDTVHGSPADINGTYRQSGAWYSKTINSIPLNKSGLQIKMQILSYYNVRGAGNAY
ncbi:hypothetical protein CBW65_11320 [Tumebacillus avium]|uniref:Uncharacterized protein n=1 Tax=Tumebacillus avium TaxID=1903704 RepID=A0A1Y0IQ87_9BACL|nr:hypothetical protein [Tumebacillus avium]ARU61533.1 hypothetical protein CBW65_11320 [Tumebacillus avium]